MDGGPAPSALIRWGAAAGIVYFLSFAYLFFGTGEFIEAPTSEELIAFYQANEALYIWVPYFVVALAAVGFVLLATALRGVLMAVEDRPGHMTTVFYTASGLFALALVFANAAFTASATTAVFTENPEAVLTPAIDETASGIGALGLGGAQFILALGLVALAIVVLRTRVLGVWFAWASIVLAAAGLLVLPLFIGFFAPPVWALAAAVALLTRPGRGSNRSVDQKTAAAS